MSPLYCFISLILLGYYSNQVILNKHFFIFDFYDQSIDWDRQVTINWDQQSIEINNWMRSKTDCDWQRLMINWDWQSTLRCSMKIFYVKEYFLNGWKHWHTFWQRPFNVYLLMRVLQMKLTDLSRLPPKYLRVIHKCRLHSFCYQAI